ncbi:MAG: hypothetical protein VST70_06960 [Nitrospirota bacterium]|nr:hypothetical protein [Nitrospirota bacterium]
MRSWVCEKTVWHRMVGDFECLIDEGDEKFPFHFSVQEQRGSYEGYMGPARSYDEAMEFIKNFLRCKGLTIPRQQTLPGLER